MEKIFLREKYNLLGKSFWPKSFLILAKFEFRFREKFEKEM